MPWGWECSIPGCKEAIHAEIRKTNICYKYTHFNAPDPRFVRDKERAAWASKLKAIVVRLNRDKECILDRYRRDTVKVCERHFADEDLIYIESRNGGIHKKLRKGALPTLEMPKKETHLLPNPYAKELNKGHHKPTPRPPPTAVIRQKSFKCLVVNAKQLQANKVWDIKIGEELIEILKASEDHHDQPQYHVAIDKDFKIWVSHFGWPLPGDHSLCRCDLHQKTLKEFLSEVDTLKPCTGIKIPPQSEPSKFNKAHKHVITTSSKPFAYSTVNMTVCAYRAAECDVLLAAEGLCKSCSKENNYIKRCVVRGEKMALASFSRCPQINEADSYIVKRLKHNYMEKCKELRQRQQDLSKVHEMLLSQKVKLQKNEQDLQEQSVSLMEAVSDYIKLQKSEKEREEKSVVFMETISNYLRLSGASPVCEKFWSLQVKAMSPPISSTNGMRYGLDIIGFLGDIFFEDVTSYNRLRDSKLFVLPSTKSLKSYWEKRKADVDDIIVKVSQSGTIPECSGVDDTCSGLPNVPDATIQEDDEVPSPHPRLSEASQESIGVTDFSAVLPNTTHEDERGSGSISSLPDTAQENSRVAGSIAVLSKTAQGNTGITGSTREERAVPPPPPQLSTKLAFCQQVPHTVHLMQSTGRGDRVEPVQNELPQIIVEIIAQNAVAGNETRNKQTEVELPRTVHKPSRSFRNTLRCTANSMPKTSNGALLTELHAPEEIKDRRRLKRKINSKDKAADIPGPNTKVPRYAVSVVAMAGRVDHKSHIQSPFFLVPLTKERNCKR